MRAPTSFSAHMAILMLSAAIIISQTGFSLASSVSIYEHNGSVVDIATTGDAIQGIYSTPRPGLDQAGIKRGTVLFEGRYEGERIVATAFAFKAGCRPEPYEVIGQEVENDILLKGPSPIRDPRGCKVIRYSADSPNAVLLFKYSTTHH